MCCPINSTIVNGTCGCDSSTGITNKFYVASNIKTNLDLSFTNKLAQRFTCISSCPLNSIATPNGLNAFCECNDGFMNTLTGTYPFSNFYCIC